jgi:hypothetical protein
MKWGDAGVCLTDLPMWWAQQKSHRDELLDF